MEDWKRKLNYNFHSSYHAYAFGLLYQHEQNNGNMNNWTEDGVMDLSNYNAGMSQAYYAANATKTREDSAPANASYHATNGHCQYRGSGVVYFEETQSGRLVVAAPQQTTYNDPANEVRRAQSDSASDSDAHTSPDSWRSGSSRDGSLPQADPATWARKDYENDPNNRGIIYQDVPYLFEEPRPQLPVPGNQNINTNYENVPMPPQKKRSTTTEATKGKVRAAFSESQMSILYQRFSVQRYLPPAEMKNLAELTGLTYKQVKTWFQNRRMKLRRHQKDNSWVCERYNTNKDVHGNFYNNTPTHMQPYGGDAVPNLKEHYNQHMMDAAYRKSAQQNMAFYLAGPAGYPTWSSSCSQPAVPPRPQVTGWSMPQNVGHYEYNPNAPPFSPAATNTAVDNTSFESQDTEPANSSGSLSTGVVNNASQ